MPAEPLDLTHGASSLRGAYIGKLWVRPTKCFTLFRSSLKGILAFLGENLNGNPFFDSFLLLIYEG